MSTDAARTLEPINASGSGVCESRVGYEWEFEQHPGGVRFMLTVAISGIAMSRVYSSEICESKIVSESANIAQCLNESILLVEHPMEMEPKTRRNR